MQDTKTRLRPVARDAVIHSPELRGWRLIEDTYVPGLLKAGQDLEYLTGQVQATIWQAIPTIQDLLARNGLALPAAPKYPTEGNRPSSPSIALLGRQSKTPITVGSCD